MASNERYQQGLAKLYEIAGNRQKSALTDWQEVAPKKQALDDLPNQKLGWSPHQLSVIKTWQSFRLQNRQKG